MRAWVSIAWLAATHAAGTIFSAGSEKPLHLVVGFPPGSQPDIVARLLGRKLAEAAGRAVVVDNVTGASGEIAADRVARAAPDGLTVGLLSQTHIVINPLLHALPPDAAQAFMPVTEVAVSPNVLVVPAASAVTSVRDLVAFARQHPGDLTFASSGSGSGTHMAAERFKAAAGIDLRHIPYKGVVAAIPDLVEGRISMMFSPLPVVWPLVREGKLRALAVTSLRRSPAAAGVPTVAESGYPEFEATNWYGLFVPAGTPRIVVARLHDDAAKALASADLRASLSDLGLDVVGNSPEEFAALIRAEVPKWAEVIRRAAIKPE
jgi:tripartite-type tricarboxylate transporter receptor subunit TctC